MSHRPHDPNHPAMPNTTGAYPPQSAEVGSFGSQGYGQHESPVPLQEGGPEYGQYGVPTAQPWEHSPATKRPGAVIAGCVLAWIGSAVGLLAGVSILAFVDESTFVDAGLGVDADDAAAAIRATAVLMLGWCAAVAVLTGFAFAGRRWAAIALLAMAAVAALVGLLNALSGSGEGLLLLAWSVGSAMLIYQNRSARQWYAAMAARR